MRTAVSFIPEHSIGQIVELAVEAERLGYDRCWVYDEGLAARDVYVTMTAIAASTETIEIGPGVTNPYTRHPGVTASAIAALDELSGGRAFLGIGAGGSLTLGPMGIERTRPITAMRDTILTARALFAGDGSYDGRFSSVRSSRLAHARPDLEVWVAGRGPQVLRLGGELADGVLIDFIHEELVGEYLDRVATGVVEGRRMPQLSYATAVITDDKAMRDTKPHMTYRLVDSQPAVRRMLGVSDDHVARIASAMSDGLHAAAEHVREEWVLPFVIAGTTDECAETLQARMTEHGFEEFMLPVYELDGAAELMATVADVCRTSS